METFLRNNPGIRWLIISVLLILILLQSVAIANRVFVLGEPPGEFGMQPVEDGEIVSTPSPVQLTCTLENYVNLRTDPFVGEDNRITTLSEGTQVTAEARNGPVPWLYVRDEAGNEGWLSSQGTDGNALVECDGPIQSLPEREADSSARRQEVNNDETTEETSQPAIEPTFTPQPTITTAPAVRLREGNGPNLHAASRTFNITIDGDISEWNSTSAADIANAVHGADKWQGPQDASGVARAAWDESYLYLAARVRDDVIVQQSKDDLLVRGDSVEFFFDVDLQNNFEVDEYGSQEIAQMVFSPGNFEGNEPSAWVYQSPAGNFRPEIPVASRRTETGYDLEVRLPWTRLNVQPAPGKVFGYAVTVSDNDSPGAQQETQISITPQKPYLHPTRWSNFILD